MIKILDIKIFLKNVNDVTKNRLISIKNVSSVQKIVHKMWSNIFEKWSCAILEQIFGSFFTEKTILCTRKMENHLFVQRK